MLFGGIFTFLNNMGIKNKYKLDIRVECDYDGCKNAFSYEHKSRCNSIQPPNPILPPTIANGWTTRLSIRPGLGATYAYCPEHSKFD